MISIKDLLNKIKWDKRERIEDYSIEYFDRIKNKNIEIRLKDVEIEGDYVISGESTIPLHRIRKVKKKGKVIWNRL